MIRATAMTGLCGLNGSIVMNDNKLAKLREVGYRLNDVCGECVAGSFIDGKPVGICVMHQYVDEGHGKVRNIGVHRYGSCGSFERKR